MTEPAAPPVPERQNRPSVLSRRKKILLVAGGSVVGLVLLTLLLGPPIIGAIARSKIRSILGDALRAEVAVDDVSFRWSGRVAISGLRVVPRGFSDPLLEVKEVQADLDLLAALGGNYLARVEVVAPRLLVEKNEAGAFNYEIPPRPPKPPRPKDKEPSEPRVVRASLKVREGRVVVRGRGRETEFVNVAVDATVDALDKPVEVRVSLDGAGGDKLRAQGTIDLLRMAGPATVVLENVSLKNLTGAARAYSPVVELDGRLNGVLEYRLEGNLRLSGKGQVQVGGLEAGLPGGPVKLDRVTLLHEGSLDENGNGRHTLAVTSGRALTATATAQVTDLLGPGRVVVARLNAESDLAELGRAVEKLVGIKPGMTVEGKASLTGTVETRGADRVRADLALKASEVVAVDVAQKKRYDLDRAVSAKLAASWDGGTRTVAADAATLESSFATLDAKGGVVLAGKEPEIKASTLKLRADLEKLSAKLAHFMEDPPRLAGLLEANATYEGDRYTVAAEAKGVTIVTTAKTIGPIDARLDQRGTFAGGALKIDVSDFTSSAANVKVSGRVAQALEEVRTGSLTVEGILKPAELSRWIPELGLGGPEISLETAVALKPGHVLIAGSTKLDGLTADGKDEKGQPVSRTLRTGPVNFTVERKGKDVVATAKAAAFEWIEKATSAKGELDARVTVDEKGTTGTTRITNLEVVDEKKNTVKEPAVTVVHDIAFGSYDIRKLEVTSGFLKGTVRGKVLDRDGKKAFERLEGKFTYIPDRLGAVLGPWLPGKFEGAEERSGSVTLNGEAKSVDLLGILRGARGEVDLDLAKFTMQGITVSGRTKLALEGGRVTSTLPFDVNRGKTDLTGSIDFRDARERPQSALDLKARDVGANAHMGSLLESVSPIFHTYNGTVDGKITSEFRLFWRGPLDPTSADLKKEAARFLEGSGALSVKDLNVVGSPAVAELMKAMGEGNSIQGDLVATDIRVAGGRCEYKNMTLRLKRYELRFSGWVDFYDEEGKDRKYMHLMVEMPMTEGITRRYPNLQKYLGKTFFVPLEGTVDKPRLDFEGAIAELAKRALEGVVQDKLEDALKRFLERRKK